MRLPDLNRKADRLHRRQQRSGSTMVGLRVLVAEDYWLLANDLASALRARGAEVVGPVPTLADALRLVGSGSPLDAALLNVSLGDEASYPAADLLAARDVPFVFVTGYDVAVLPTRYARVPCCQKPVAPEKALHALLLWRARCRRGI